HVNDARGIPHILEHIVLEGSKKYPLQNMFYRLSDKNFETMMNAGTYTDFTCYYFATNLDNGFMNLADVYLDSVFNPLIT
ncbi:insulinase family protein, partial [Enterococcus faecalis]|uniref:insulinase family protein n=1 Tax=Enterococcus faecalis TaxID=1351 RepID=UPI0010C1FE41